MKFTVTRDALADAAAVAARTVPRSPTLPVLAGVRLDVDGDRLTVAAYDYELASTITVEATSTEPGTVLLSARLLADITHSLPAGEPVTCAVEGSKVRLTCRASTFTLLTLPLEDYPSLPEAPAALGTVDADAFATAAQRTLIAAAHDATLPALCAVRLRLTPTGIVLEATDRYRLASARLAWQATERDDELAAHLADNIEAYVPATALADIARSLAGGGTLRIGAALPADPNGPSGNLPTLAAFNTPGRELTTRLAAEPMPGTDAMWPETAQHLDVDAGLLRESIKRVAVVAERNPPVRLIAETDTLTLEAGTGDEAQATETLPCALHAPEPMRAAFNPGFLAEGAAAVQADTVRLAFTTVIRPFVLTAANQPDAASTDYRYLLMPVRLSG